MEYFQVMESILSKIHPNEDGFYSLHLDGLRFESAFQPIYDKTMAIYGVECLVRIFDAQGHSINPGLFFSELSDQLERFSFAILAASTLHVRNFAKSNYRDKHLFINTSPLLFEELANNPSAIDHLVGALHYYGLAPSQLIYEIMEMAGESERLAVNGVQNLLNNQIRTAIDDFGSHYSTKERVRIIRPAFVKVDKSIIQAGMSPMKSAIACAHSVNALTIAEGIEDQQTLNQCIEVGFDYFQGYYLARPTKPM